MTTHTSPGRSLSETLRRQPRASPSNMVVCMSNSFQLISSDYCKEMGIKEIKGHFVNTYTAIMLCEYMLCEYMLYGLIVWGTN